MNQLSLINVYRIGTKLENGASLKYFLASSLKIIEYVPLPWFIIYLRMRCHKIF